MMEDRRCRSNRIETMRVWIRAKELVTGLATTTRSTMSL